MPAAAPVGVRDDAENDAPERADDGFDPDAGWALHPQVALRPEPFGALLYHFHTRKLSFLKCPLIVDVVSSLAGHDTARSALAAHGVDLAEPHTERLYLHALGQLAASRMIVRREGRDTPDTLENGEGREHTATVGGHATTDSRIQEAS